MTSRRGPRIPIGRGSRLKSGSVWVRPPAGAPRSFAISPTTRDPSGTVRDGKGLLTDGVRRDGAAQVRLGDGPRCGGGHGGGCDGPGSRGPHRRAVATGAAPAQGTSTSRLITTSHGTAVTSRFFGMHAPLLGTTFPAASVGAFDLTTNNVYWPNLETAPGVFDFARLDAMVAQAHGNAAKPLLVLGVTPSFHGAPGSVEPITGASLPDMDAWKAYVRAVVTQYTDTIEYQIWPEPNVTNNFTGTPQQMADLVAAASDIIREVAPHATVVAPAMVMRLKSERTFMAKFFAAKVNGRPIGDYVDAVGVDPYPLEKGTPEDALRLVDRARAILAKDRVSLPVWNLEINYFVPVGGVTTASPPSDRLASSYVIRTFVLNSAANVKRVYWLGWLQYFKLGISLGRGGGVKPGAPGAACAP